MRCACAWRTGAAGCSPPGAFGGGLLDDSATPVWSAAASVGRRNKRDDEDTIGLLDYGKKKKIIVAIILVNIEIMIIQAIILSLKTCIYSVRLQKKKTL